MTGGAIGTLSGTSSHNGIGVVEKELTIYVVGSEGQFSLDIERGRAWLGRYDGEETVDLGHEGALYDCDGPPHALIDLALGVEGAVNCAPGELGARTVEILDAAYRTARSGRSEAIGKISTASAVGVQAEKSTEGCKGSRKRSPLVLSAPMTRAVRADRPRRPGMRDVAQQAGVAISSVSRVLSGHPDVSPDMRDKVMAVVEELGYHPDMLAQGLRRQTTMSIGFAASNISNPALTDAVIGAEGELRRAGYSLLLTDADGDPELDAANIALLQRRRVDAILLAHGDERHPAVRKAIMDADIPLVLIDRDGPRGAKIPIVKFDHRTGMRQAGEALRDLGHKDIAMLVGGPRRPARERKAGVLDVYGEAKGLSCEVLEGDFSIAFGYEATRRLLAATRRPTALIAGGNVLMHGSLRALRDAGVHVGRDVSFVGCDDVAVAEFHDPQIAMVRRAPRDAGVEAARMLVRLLHDEVEPDDVTLPTAYAPGASVAKPR